MISAVFDFDATCNGWPLRAAAVDVAHYVPFVDIRGPFDGTSEQGSDFGISSPAIAGNRLLSGSEPVLDPDILAVDVAEVGQASSERVEYRGV